MLADAVIDTSGHEAIYRLLYHLEARLVELERVVDDHRTSSTQDRAAMHRQLERHVAVLRACQTRLNLVVVLMISVGLFALAGPDGLRQIAAVIHGGDDGLGADGLATIAGVVIPILYPLGRRFFLSVRPEEQKTGESANGPQ